jgi:hypothetical protein
MKYKVYKDDAKIASTIIVREDGAMTCSFYNTRDAIEPYISMGPWRDDVPEWLEDCKELIFEGEYHD